MNRINTMKTSLSSLRSLLAAMVLFCLSALSATAQSVTQNHIKYNINNSTKTAIAAGADDRNILNVVIADSVMYSGKYYPVVAVNSKAFQDYTKIRTVSFGSNLTKIGSYAFAGCQFLSEIIVPEGVESIENYAFQNCSMRYADLPSTLRTLGSGVFKTNAVQELDTLVLRTAYYDAAGQMSILPFNTSCFNSKTRLKNSVLMVPKKAFEYYVASTTATGAFNWGYFFENNIVSFGTAPTGCTVVPQEGLKDFRDLSNVEVTFNFDDEKLQNVLSYGPNDYINAALVLPSGKSLSADDVVFKGNSICLDFAAVLQKNRELFIAPSEDDAAIDVRLQLDGQIQLEECPFMLGSFFAHHAISWNVPLLPSVYDLPKAPTVEPGGEAQNGRYDYKAFEAVTLTFDGYTDLSLDSSTGAYISARLYKDGQLLSVSQRAVVNGRNVLTIPFAIPVEDLMVRGSSGIDSYGFMLEVEGQVSMKEQGEMKNFRFALLNKETSSAPFWTVNAVYIPEPKGVNFLPADTNVSASELSDIAVNFEGVSKVALSKANDALPLKATLLMEGDELLSIGADRVRVVDNTLHLLFDPVDQRLITLISNDANHSYDFALTLSADLVTDGYPCRVVIGEEPNGPGSANDSTSVASPYTLRWVSPQWTVPAIVCEVPEIKVNVPAVCDEDILTYNQLDVIELNVENYKSVQLKPAGTTTAAASNAVGRLLRYGNTVCVASGIKTDGSKIILDFSDNLTYNAVGITPDDDPDVPVELALHLEGDFLFDGLPYHLVVDGYKEGMKWKVESVVVNKLPAPSIEHVGNRIFFVSGVEDVEYHYAITNADATGVTTVVANKTKGGSSWRVPLQRSYTVSVYSTREGYEDSDVVTVNLLLEGEPRVEEKK